MWICREYFLSYLNSFMILINFGCCIPELVDTFYNEVERKLNISGLHKFHSKCTKVEDVKLTFQEWSDIILVSIHSSSSSSFSSSSSTIQSAPFDAYKGKNHLKDTQHHYHHQQDHQSQLQLKFVVNKTSYDLPLRWYREVFRETLQVVLNSNKTVFKSIPRNCYYYGSTWKNRRTLQISAFISFCNKTSGLILMGGETFIIRPLEFNICEPNDEISQTHIAFKILPQADGKGLDPICGTNLWKWKNFRDAHPHKAEFLRNLKISKSKNNNKLYCLVVKLGLILDHSLLIKLNTSVEEVKHQMLLLSNALNQILKELHKSIHLELVHLELWRDRDVFPTSSGIRWTLPSLVDFAKKLIDAEGSTFHYLHLLSGHHINGEFYGASIPDSICSERAVGVSHVENPYDIISMASGIIHMFGHVIGLQHDGLQDNLGTNCPDVRGFAMSPRKTSINHLHSPLPLSSVDLSWNKSKNKRNNGTSHLNDFHHHHRQRHFQLGWSNCSLHDFGLNLRSKFLQCLRGSCGSQHQNGGNATDNGGSDVNGVSSPAVDEDGDDASGSKKNFQTRCGNGMLERGEECDCGDKQDCLASDPCCDFTTCLLKPWTACRKGDCCLNCSLVPSTQVCRRMKNSCDVPEFCTGILEECPGDSVVLDGQPCIQAEPANDSSDTSICYRGLCRSYDNQCSSLWGTGSSRASDGCFSTFNQIGAISGHCGSSSSTSSKPPPANFSIDEEMDVSSMPYSMLDYLKCSQRDVKCGLLHCKGGFPKPLVENNVSFFFETTITSHGNSYQCKVVSNPIDPFLHLVEDGSPCSENSMCISGKCVLIAEVGATHLCPSGANSLICSGNGVCTDRNECFCKDLYSGSDCSVAANKTAPSDDLEEDLYKLENVQKYYNNSFFNITEDVEAVAIGKRSSLNNLWLLGAMSCVIIGASAILILCLVCYRRKTPKLTKKQQICQLRNQSLMSISSHDTNPRVNRIISFGSLPSYRADKLRKAMRGSNQSETESEKSSKRNSAEVSVRVSKEPKATYLPLPDPPDRGILKRPENKGQRRNKIKDELAGSDISSVPSESLACGERRKDQVYELDKVRSRVEKRIEMLSHSNHKDDVKPVRNSVVMMPDILPKVSCHKTNEINSNQAIDSKISNRNSLSIDLKVGNKCSANENSSRTLKSKFAEEASFIEDTGTMSSFLSTSDMEALPRPGAPAPSLCSEDSPSQAPFLSSSPQFLPINATSAELKRNLRRLSSDAPSIPSFLLSNSTSLTGTSYSTDQGGRDPTFVPLRKSVEYSNNRTIGATRDSGVARQASLKIVTTSGTCHCPPAPSHGSLHINRLSNVHFSQSCYHDGAPIASQESRDRTSSQTTTSQLEKPLKRDRNINSDANVFRPDPRGAYTKAPGSPGTPDDHETDVVHGTDAKS